MNRRIIITLFSALALASCIKNDLPKPTVDLFIASLDVEGVGGDIVLDRSTYTATIPLAEEINIEQVQFNPNTGVRQSRPRIQKFEPKSWPGIQRILRQQGWTIDILYDPTAWLKEQEAKRLEMQELTYKQRQELEAKRKAEERKALKAEILAELKEAGLIKEPKADGSKKSK